MTTDVPIESIKLKVRKRKLKEMVAELFDRVRVLESQARASIQASRELFDRVGRLEKVAHEPVDLTSIAMDKAEAVAKLLETNPHMFGPTDCEPCKRIGQLLGRAFGCDAVKIRMGGDCPHRNCEYDRSKDRTLCLDCDREFKGSEVYDLSLRYPIGHGG